MGKSYADIKYDIWYNLERFGIPKDSLRLLMLPQPGNRIIYHGLRPVIGVNHGALLSRGVLGECLYFNGSSNYLTVGALGFTRAAGEPLTTIAHGSLFANNTGDIIGCRNGSGAGDLWKLYRSGTGFVFEYDPTGSGRTVTSSLDGNGSNWYKIAGRYNGNTIDIIAQTNAASITKTSSTTKTSAAIDQDLYMIGRRPDAAGQNLEGNLYGVELYTHGLTDAQIKRRFRSPSELLTPRPDISYFDQATGSALSPINGTLDAASDVVASINIARSLGGQLAAAAAGQSIISITRSLSGSGAGVSSVDGAASINRGLSGSFAGVAFLESAVSVSRGLAGHLAAIGTLAADISISGTVTLAGGLSAAADTLAALAVNKSFAGNLSAAGTVQAQLSAIRRLAGMLDAGADIAGSITVTESGIVSLAGNIAAMGALQAALNIRRGLSGGLIATTDMTGQVTLSLAFSGSADAVADLAGALQVVGESILGIVIDPTMESITVKRILESITIKRILESITIKRTINSK